MDNKNYENWAFETALTLDDISKLIKVNGIKFIDEDHLAIADYLSQISKLIFEFETTETSLDLLQEQKDLLPTSRKHESAR